MVGQGGLVGGVWGKANPPGQRVGALGVEGGVETGAISLISH